MEEDVYQNSKANANGKEEAFVLKFRRTHLSEAQEMRNQHGIHCHCGNPRAPLAEQDEEREIQQEYLHRKAEQPEQYGGNKQGGGKGKQPCQGGADCLFLGGLHGKYCDNPRRKRKVQSECLCHKDCRNCGSRHFHCIQKKRRGSFKSP